MTDEEIRRVAEEAANRAVSKVFAVLGVDFADPAEIEDLRRDLRYAGWVRKVSEKSILAAIGAMAVGAVAALFLGVAGFLNGGGR
jgi:hypothetical protein